MLKSIFISFILFISLSSTSFSQWWVDGGNLIWPYGNIKITKGVIEVDSTITCDSLSISGGLKVNGLTKLKSTQISGTGISYISEGDSWIQVDGGSNDIEVQSITQIYIGDHAADLNSTQITVDDPNEKINLAADSVNISKDLKIGGDLIINSQHINRQLHFDFNLVYSVEDQELNILISRNDFPSLDSVYKDLSTKRLYFEFPSGSFPVNEYNFLCFASIYKADSIGANPAYVGCQLVRVNDSTLYLMFTDENEEDIMPYILQGYFSFIFSPSNYAYLRSSNYYRSDF